MCSSGSTQLRLALNLACLLRVSSEHWSLYSRSLVQSRKSGREARTWGREGRLVEEEGLGSPGRAPYRA